MATMVTITHPGKQRENGWRTMVVCLLYWKIGILYDNSGYMAFQKREKERGKGRRSGANNARNEKTVIMVIDFYFSINELAGFAKASFRIICMYL